MTADYVAPEYLSDGFHCPHCKAFAHQEWHTEVLAFKVPSRIKATTELAVSVCGRCRRQAVWRDQGMLYPAVASAPLPHPDMPSPARDIYEEARQVLGVSPRSAIALLRLATESLVNGLDPKAGRLNDKIGRLVQRGMHQQVVQALDTLRVIGNNAVHPGEINVDEDPALARSLFGALNLIVQQVITAEKETQALYDLLPDAQKAQIDKRNAKALASQ